MKIEKYLNNLRQELVIAIDNAIIINQPYVEEKENRKGKSNAKNNTNYPW